MYELDMKEEPRKILLTKKYVLVRAAMLKSFKSFIIHMLSAMKNC